MWARLVNKILVVIFTWIKKWRLFPPAPQNQGEPGRILLVCVAGVGDNLLCAPAVGAVRNTFPESFIAFLVHRKRWDTLKNNPMLNEIIAYHKGPVAFFKLAVLLRKKRFDNVVVFHSTHGDLLPLCYLTGSPAIIGFEENSPMDFLYTRMIPRDASLHSIQDRVRLVREIGADTRDFHMTWRTLPEEKRAAEKLLQENGLTEKHPLIAFQLGAGGDGKRWPLESYAELARMIENRFGVFPILFGSEKERGLLENLRSRLGGNACCLITDLRILGALMEKIDLLVTPDTGPMHIAIALETPSVILFGKDNDHVFGPMPGFSGKTVVLKKTSGQDASTGMESIRPEEALRAIGEILSDRSDVERGEKARLDITSKCSTS